MRKAKVLLQCTVNSLSGPFQSSLLIHMGQEACKAVLNPFLLIHDVRDKGNIAFKFSVVFSTAMCLFRLTY